MLNSQEPAYLDSKSYQIYALIDPRDSLVYYVGLSIDAQARFKGHLSSGNIRETAWIDSLQREGKQPTLHILETIEAGAGAYAAACELEHYWIHELALSGNPLLNQIGITRSYVPPRIGTPRLKEVIVDVKLIPGDVISRAENIIGQLPSEVNTMPQDEEMLTVEEVANLLRVGDKTVRRWIKNGELIAIDVGREYRIPRSNYDDFKRRRETGRHEKRPSKTSPTGGDEQD